MGHTETPPARILLIAAACAALATLGFMVNGVRQNAGAGNVDFFILLDSGVQIRAGQSPYASIRLYHSLDGVPRVYPNLNHPAVAVALVPLTFIPRPVASWLWAFGGLVLYLLAGVAATRALGAWDAPARRGLALCGLIVFPGLSYSVITGQVGAPLAALAMLAWVALRRGRWVWAGVAVGVLVVLKPFLLPLLALFLARRRWGGFAGVLAGAGGLSLVVLPVVGLAGYRGWFGVLGTPTWQGGIINASLIGWLYRLWPAPPHALVYGTIAALCLAGVLIVRAEPGSGVNPVDRDLAALLAVAILASPLGWVHYLPLLAAPVAGLLAAWSALPARRRRALLWSLPLAWLPPLATVPLLALLVALARRRYAST